MPSLRVHFEWVKGETETYYFSVKAGGVYVNMASTYAAGKLIAKETRATTATPVLTLLSSAGDIILGGAVANNLGIRPTRAKTKDITQDRLEFDLFLYPTGNYANPPRFFGGEIIWVDSLFSDSEQLSV